MFRPWLAVARRGARPTRDRGRGSPDRGDGVTRGAGRPSRSASDPAACGASPRTMTGSAPVPGRRSAAWAVAFRVMYRGLRPRPADPVVAGGGIARPRRPSSSDTSGRRSGRPRRTLVTILDVDGRWYVGHPNGSAQWVRNIEAAGVVEIEPAARWVLGSRWIDWNPVRSATPSFGPPGRSSRSRQTTSIAPLDVTWPRSASRRLEPIPSQPTTPAPPGIA